MDINEGFFRCLLVPAGYSVEICSQMQDIRKGANANPNRTPWRVLQNMSTFCSKHEPGTHA